MLSGTSLLSWSWLPRLRIKEKRQQVSYILRMDRETTRDQTTLPGLLGDDLTGNGTPSIISPTGPYYIFADRVKRKGV